MHVLLFLQNYKKNYEFHVYEIWELGNIMCFSSPCKFLERKRGTFYVRGLQNMTICCCESFTLQSKLCHLKLQQKLHYRNLVQSLKITSSILRVNITYNAYCYSTINALALMLMLMFSVYLNNFPQHKKRSESISVMYVSLSNFSLPLNAQMHVPSPYVLVLRVWVGHPISSKREKEDLTRLYGNMNLNIIYPSVPHNHSVYVSGLKW